MMIDMIELTLFIIIKVNNSEQFLSDCDRCMSQNLFSVIVFSLCYMYSASFKRLALYTLFELYQLLKAASLSILNIPKQRSVFILGLIYTVCTDLHKGIGEEGLTFYSNMGITTLQSQEYIYFLKLVWYVFKMFFLYC
jgi:hypothetical protein